MDHASPAFAHCMAFLREADRDRYLSTLLAPRPARHWLAALYAFNAEIARIRDVVSEPMPGEMRIQWWRDAISGRPLGGAEAHPIASALVATIEANDLPRHAFDGYLEARIFDLYDDPMPDRARFEGYAGETASTIIQLAAMMLDRHAAAHSGEAAGHAGIAQLVAGSLLLLPRHRARGQVFLPADLLGAVGLDRARFIDAADRAATARAVEAFLALGRDHLGRAEAALALLPPTLMPAFLPVALAPLVFERAGGDPSGALDRPPLAPQWRRQWRLWRALSRRRLA